MVIAIISILAALLMPALKSAREKSKQISCLNRLRQLHLAFNVYAQENNGYLPSNQSDRNATRATTWCVLIQRQFQVNDPDNLAMKKYLSCPSAEPVADADWYWWYSEYAVNLNTSVFGYDATQPSQLPTGNIAARMMAMDIEGFVRTVNFYNQIYFSGRHFGGSNILYCDGHVGWLRTSDIPVSWSDFGGPFWGPE